MRTFVIAVVMVMILAGAVLTQQTDRARSTVNLPCGTFRAVRVIVDGRETQTSGILRGRSVYLPARESLESLGGSVTWVQNQRSFYAQFPDRGRTVRATVGSPTVRIYRHSPGARYGAGPATGRVNLGSSPFNCSGRVYAPVRAAAEAAGATVDYDAATRTVRVTSSPRNGNR